MGRGPEPPCHSEPEIVTMQPYRHDCQCPYSMPVPGVMIVTVGLGWPVVKKVEKIPP